MFARAPPTLIISYTRTKGLKKYLEAFLKVPAINLDGISTKVPEKRFSGIY
jgi:hypothetical protein